MLKKEIFFGFLVFFIMIFGFFGCKDEINIPIRSNESLNYEKKLKENKNKSDTKNQNLINNIEKKDKNLKQKRKEIDENGFKRIEKYYRSNKLNTYPPKS